MVEWYAADLFYDLSAVDLAVLCAIGLTWSAAVWVIVEGVKHRLNLRKPYTKRERRQLAWSPVLASSVLAALAFPVIIGGVSELAELGPATVGAGLILGALAGLTSKAAHDIAGKFMAAAVGRVLDLVSGRGK